MKLKSSVLTVVLVASTLANQAQIAQWTFEVAPPADLINSQNFGPLNADIGTGMMSGHHASAASDWTTPASGNGSANPLSVNNWTAGDYLQFQVSTLGGGGASHLELSWDHTSSGTGPRDFELQYSTDGTTFTPFFSYSVLENVEVLSPDPQARTEWKATGGRQPIYTFSADTSSLPGGAVGQSTAFFRLADAGTTSANGGTVVGGGSSRVDNVTVSFAAVPEPEEYAAVVAGSLVAFAILRRRLACAQ